MDDNFDMIDGPMILIGCLVIGFFAALVGVAVGLLFGWLWL